MSKEIPTIPHIVKAAGGAKAIADCLGGKPTEWAVYKWSTAGIPDRYWPLIIGLANVSSEDLLAANAEARRQAAKREKAACPTSPTTP